MSYLSLIIHHKCTTIYNSSWLYFLIAVAYNFVLSVFSCLSCKCDVTDIFRMCSGRQKPNVITFYLKLPLGISKKYYYIIFHVMIVMTILKCFSDKIIQWNLEVEYNDWFHTKFQHCISPRRALVPINRWRSTIILSRSTPFQVSRNKFIPVPPSLYPSPHSLIVILLHGAPCSKQQHQQTSVTQTPSSRSRKLNYFNSYRFAIGFNCYSLPFNHLTPLTNGTEN